MTPQPPAFPPTASLMPPQPGAPQTPAGPMNPASRSNGTDEILRKYGNELRQLVVKQCRDSTDKEKIWQYAVIRRNELYFRGNQYLAPTFSGTSGDIVDYKPVNGQLLLASGGTNQKQGVVNDYVLNHFRGEMRKLVGVLGSKSPNCKAMPSWDSDETGISKSNLANDCASYLKSQWDVDAANRYLVLSLGKNGTSFIHTAFVTDASRYGTHQEPVWGMQEEKLEPDTYQCAECGTPAPTPPPPACPYCGTPYKPEDFRPGATQQVPAIVGQKDYPNGTVELSIHSAYDVTTPFYIKDLEHCPWLYLDSEDDAAWLVQRYPGVGLEDDLQRAQSTPSTVTGSSSGLGKLAREQASSPTGYSLYQRPNRWAHTRFWLTPAMYWYLTTLNLPQSAVDEVKAVCPRGMKLTFVNNRDLPVKIEHERLDEVWAAVKPETSEYLYADPLFNDFIQGSDIINDAWNITIKLMESSIPAILYDPQVLSKNKIRQGFAVNEFIPVNAGQGPGLAEKFFRVPTADIKPELINLMKEVLAGLREMTGLLPAIWGGEGVPNETAEAARRRLNQALMVLATTWGGMTGGWARAYRNGIRQLARYSLGRLVSSLGDPESVTIKEISELQTLLEGGWDVTCDQSVPVGYAQIKDFIEATFTMNPDQAHKIGADDPENLAMYNNIVGIPGWKIPGVEERSRVLDLIDRLLKEAPVDDGTGNKLPSIPLDFKLTWTPNIVIPIIHGFLMSPAGKSAEGSPGYDNVCAAGMAAIEFVQASNAPPPGPPPGPPPKGGKGAPGPDSANPPLGGLPETLPGANAPVAPEPPLPPMPGGGPDNLQPTTTIQ